MTTRMSSQQRREQIVDAAIKIIGEKGPRAFTAAHVAELVGIRDATIFRHFKNKDAIISAVLARLETVLDATMPAPSDDPLQNLSDFFMSRIELIAQQPGVQQLLFSDDLSHTASADDLERVRALRRRNRAYISTCLQQASQLGMLRPDAHIADLLVLIHGALVSLVLLAKDDALDQPIQQRAERLLSTLITMIRS